MTSFLPALQALLWVLRETLSRKKSFAVEYDLDGEVYAGVIRASSWEEASGICSPRGYRLKGIIKLSIHDCPLARWIAKHVA